MMRGVSNTAPSAARRAIRNAALILIEPAPSILSHVGLLLCKRLGLELGASVLVASAVQHLGVYAVIEFYLTV